MPVNAVETMTVEHMMTHMPYNDKCKICRAANVHKIPHRRKKNDDEGDIKVEKFGDLITADHVGTGKDGTSKNKEEYAVVMADSYTKWIEGFPKGTKSSEDTIAACQTFVGADDVVKLFYTDGAQELEAAALRLGWRHDTSPPYRPQANGVAERAVRTVVEGTRVLLEQSGLKHAWWPHAMRAFCAARNVSAIVDGGRRSAGGDSGHEDAANVAADAEQLPIPRRGTPYFLRHGENFKGKPLIFGQQIKFLPTGKQDDTFQKFAAKMHTGVFIGYRFATGGRWKG